MIPEEKKRIIHNLLHKGVSKVIDQEHLEKRLFSGEKLRIKLGIDPTGSQVHIGHAVAILKLREFQKLGHQVVIIIGDATGQVGDTSDKNSERPMLTREETLTNAKDYLSQFGKLLDIDQVEIRFNSEWLDKTTFTGVGELAKNFSVAEMLDRENFSKRFESGVRISLQEFLYPLMQWYDSVMMHADVELGGNDQYFNLLAGRRLQEAFWQEKQDIMMFSLIEGTDGRKMSKTYKNFVGLDFSAPEMFVKLMEISDDLIIKYFESCTDLYLDEIEIYQKRLESGENPRNIKIELAKAIVSLYHGEKGALEAEEYFQKVIREWVVPDEKDIPKKEIKCEGDSLPLVTLLVSAEMVKNSSEARNALTGNSVKVDNEVQTEPKYMVELSQTEYTLLQVGKKKFLHVRKQS